MIPGPFEYDAATSLPEALSLLSEYGEEAKILAGGQSLIPLMRFRLAQPAHLVDINRVPDLNTITESNGWLQLGALTRESNLDRSDLIRQRYPLLAETAAVVADPLVRNLATVGGNIAHADPANDHPATMLAYRAEVLVAGPNGERVIPIDEFFVDAFTPAITANEIVTAIRIPVPGPRTGGAYEKLERKVGDYAVAAAAVQLTLSADGVVEQAGIANTNASFSIQRASAAEAALIGSEPTTERIREVAQLAADATDPQADLRGSADYKRAVTATMTRRAITRAVERARAAS